MRRRRRHGLDGVTKATPKITSVIARVAKHSSLRCGGTAGLSIGHVSPEAAEGGAIALVEEGDRIEIDIPARSIRVAISDDELARRRARMQHKGDAAWQPTSRERSVSPALQAYAALTTSASRGAVRDVGQLKRR